MEQELILKLENISKCYTVPDGPRTDVLKGIDLEVRPGESVAVVGPSGSGKTTLLNIMGSLDSPSGGRVVFGSQDLAQQSEQELARLRNNEIGFIFQAHHLLPQCTVLENILVPTLVSNNRKGAEERAYKLLERVGMSQHADNPPTQLSGGESQRVAVIRALINSPSLILADEPTGSLDRDNSDNIAQLLAELNTEENAALVVATHAEVLSSRMEKSFELLNGKLQQ